MARRDRVPRHKSHNHRRNKNPKLSPFQREQKRAKMANQVPTLASLGSNRDIPHSQRRLFEYFEVKRARDAERRKQRQAADERTITEVPDETNAVKTRKRKAISVDSPKSKRVKVESGESSSTPSPNCNTSTEGKDPSELGRVESLNLTFSSTLGPSVKAFRSKPEEDTSADENCPRTGEQIRALKKAKKHRKKAEARRLRVAERLHSMDEELESLLKRGKERKGDANTAFERKLKQLQKEAKGQSSLKENGRAGRPSVKEAKRKATLCDTACPVENHAAEEAGGKRKSISFDDGIGDGNDNVRHHPASARPKPSAKDFYDLVDVVGFGERVVAPPVFDVVPNKNAAVSRLAAKIESEQHRPKAPSAASSDRHRLLSSLGGLGERKRLARLGLAPSVTGEVTVPDKRNVSKEKEMEILRSRVLATYQRNKRAEVAKKKGVNLNHEFPIFS